MLNGGQYYIVFIDDYTRVCWTYILCNRAHILDVVSQFTLEIITQYSVSRKVLQTNNALEFVHHALQDFCVAQGILHQTTCPYTSQQNGVAKGKHCHLLDITRMLLLEMSIPKSDVVLTVTLLIHCMPSSALNGAIPI